MREVLVVHCVDAEGPLGGDARRNPDGTPEFLDTWDKIMRTLNDLCSPRSRHDMADSHGNPYRWSWFALDFTGFKTNPKHRDTTPHTVIDHLQQLPGIGLDSIEFHHHAVPPSGNGDEWTDEWDFIYANLQLLTRREQRNNIPTAFRAGGTIETPAMDGFLDAFFDLDFSNRVSERSTGTGGLEFFDWYGAPTRWGAYRKHPEGRWIYRCIDLRSRYNQLSRRHLDEAFQQTIAEDVPAVLSFFSHDHRDMRDETRDAVEMIEVASLEYGIPWRSCTCVEAHQLHVADPVPA